MPVRVFGHQLTWKAWVLILAVSACFGVLNAINTYASFLSEGLRVSWDRTLYRTLILRLSLVPFLPIIFLLVERYPLDFKKPGSFVIHVSAAIAAAYLHITLFSILFFLILSDAEPLAELNRGADPLIQFVWTVRGNFAIDFLAYWVIVGTSYVFHYHRELQRREVSAARLQASLSEARLQALQRQLNPHFFFNTLNAIAALALTRKPDAVADMLGRLGDLIRIFFDDTRPQVVPLGREMELFDPYLDIQRLSFGERLTIRVDVAPDARCALVPSMILQPLVENAIMHGIIAQPGTGSIAIEARRDGDTLRLRVSDSGPGFRKQLVQRDGIGLVNTRARLQQLYGSSYGMEYGSSTTGGASVTVVIPFAEADVAIPHAT